MGNKTNSMLHIGQSPTKPLPKQFRPVRILAFDQNEHTRTIVAENRSQDLVEFRMELEKRLGAEIEMCVAGKPERGAILAIARQLGPLVKDAKP